MIPNGTRFIGIAPEVDLTERGSALLNKRTEPYTIDDIRGYKVYTALLTQSGGSNILGTISGQPFTIGVTYLIFNPGVGADFTNIGAPNNNIGTYFVATGTTPNSYGTGPCNLNYDTGAPVVTILENTIGNIWFEYTNFGTYSINSNSLFPEFKIYGILSQRGGYNFSIEIGGGGSDSVRQISTYNNEVLTNNLLAFSPIEIRVYN